MSYGNDGGCCNSGWSMPFVFPFPGTQMNGNGWGNGGDMMGWMMMFLFFSLFGFGGYGGGFGARGGMPMPFMGCGAGAAAAAGNIAAETAAYVGAQNTADKVSSIATGVDAIAGIATANGVKLETVKDQNAAGFSNLNTHLCEGFHSISQQFNTQTMQGMNLHNGIVSLLNDMRAEQAKCCCESRYQAAADKCEVLRAIADSEARITARMDAAEKTAMLEKINALQEQKAGLKAQIDLQNQTNQLAALIQQRGCAPAPACGPCGPYFNPCFDGVQRAVNNALGERIGELLFPTTAAAATAAG